MPKPRIQPGLSFERYLALDGLNFSTLKALQVSDRAFLHAINHAFEPSDEMEKGTALHTLLLEPHLFDERYAVWTGKDRRGNAYKEWEAEIRSEGKTPLTQEGADAVGAWAALAESDAVVGDVLRAIQQKEMSATWTDAATGLKCKGRLDGIRPGVVTDVKTTAFQTPDHFEQDAVKRCYPAQLAYYMDGVSGGEIGWRAEIVVIYKGDKRGQYPPDCWVMDVSEEVIEHGRAMYRDWLRRAAEIGNVKNPTGVAKGERKLMILPAWAESQLPALSLETGDEGELIF